MGRLVFLGYFAFSLPYGAGFLSFSLIIFCLCSPSRLPIIQGGTFAFLTPTLAMLSLPKWKCPSWTQNATLVNASSPEFIEVWQTRMREVHYIFSVTYSVSGLFAFRKVPDHGRAITSGDPSVPSTHWPFTELQLPKHLFPSKKAGASLLLNRGMFSRCLQTSDD